MKKTPIAFLLMLLSSIALATDAQIPNDKVKLGVKSSVVNKVIEFEDGLGTANRKIRSDKSTGKVQFSNDGNNFKDMGSGSGGGSGIIINSDLNSDFEADGANWTASGGSFTRATVGSNLLFDTKSGVFNASAASQTLSQTAATIPGGLYGTSGAASCWFKTTATDYKLQVYDGSVVLSESVIPAFSVATKFSTYFLFPSTGTVQLRIISQSDSADLALDNCSMGEAVFNSVSQASKFGSIYWAPAAACQWDTTSNTYSGFAADSDCAAPTATGELAAPLTQIPATRIASLPPGKYHFEAHGSFYNTGTGVDCAWSFYDGSGNSGDNKNYSQAGGLVVPTISGDFEYTTSQSNMLFEIRAKNFSGGATCSVQVANADLTIAVWRYPTSSDLAVRADQLNPWVDAYVYSAGNFNLGTSGSVSKVEITDAGGLISANPGSQPVQIPCSGTNPSTGTSCAAGSEGLGVVFNVPQTGTWTACIDVAQSNGYSSGSVVSQSFYLVETPNNAQTILQGGDFSMDTSRSVPSTGTWSFPINFCKDFTFTSVGQKTLRMFYSQAITGTVTQNLILTDDNSSFGNRQFHISVKPKSVTTPTPVFPGSVFSNSAGVEIMTRARVTCSNSASAVVTQSGTWIGNPVNGGVAGTCTFDILNLPFSAEPACQVTVIRTGALGNTGCYLQGTPGTGASALVLTRFGNGANENGDCEITCMGPK